MELTRIYPTNHNLNKEYRTKKNIKPSSIISYEETLGDPMKTTVITQFEPPFVVDMPYDEFERLLKTARLTDPDGGIYG